MSAEEGRNNRKKDEEQGHEGKSGFT